nr:hypothetical protein [Maribacter aestuarii]
MKKTITSILVFAISIVFLNAQQNCSKYYPMQEGSSFQYTMYDKKGKMEGVTDYTITNVNSEGGTTNATFEMKFTDKKGKQVFNTDYNISCTDGGITIDFESLFPTQMMNQYQEMGIEMDITGTDIQLPNDLNVGKKLEDANVSVAMNMSGINMNITVDQTNRIVEKKRASRPLQVLLIVMS